MSLENTTNDDNITITLNEENVCDCGPLECKKIRLHLLGIPHTITTHEFSHCAFTGKVMRFPEMMISRGFEVYHYGNEGADCKATKQINLLSKQEFSLMRISSYQYLHPELSYEEVSKKLNDETTFVGDLANWDTPLYKLFCARILTELPKYYRGHDTDLVCIPFSPGTYDNALNNLNVVSIETGIGYSNSSKTFRIFESHAYKHRQCGIEEMNNCPNYWFVIPNYYNILEWNFSPKVDKPKIGFLGRIIDCKGCNVFKDVAEKFPNVEFVICGQGDATPYLKHPNMYYKKPIQGMERSDYLGSLTALICASIYIEPFCGVNVEAQLCGTPVIANDFGAFPETIEDKKTGLLCHTLADFCLGVQMALDGKFDRKYIRERAVKKYDMFELAKDYEYVFKCVVDLSTKNNGWYSPYCYKMIE